MRFALSLSMVLLLVASAVHAAELKIDAGGQVEYDNNIFRTNAQKVEDVIFRLYPTIKLYEDRGSDLLYSLEYQVPLSIGVTESVVNGFDHIANLNSTYQFNDRMEVDFLNRFAYVRSTLLDQEFIGTVPVPQLSTERERVLTNFTDLGFGYQITPRLSSRVEGQFGYFDPERRDRNVNYTGTALASGQYVLTPQHSLGGGLRYSYQRFLRSLNVVASEANFITVFASWRWAYSDTMLFTASVGPTWIENRSIFEARDAFNASLSTGGAIPVVTSLAAFENIGTTRNSNWTVFGNAELSKRWTPNLISGVSYERSQGVASGLGGSVVRDVLAATGNWNFAERWQLAMRVDYVIRQSVGRSVLTPLGTTTSSRATAGINSDRYGVSGRISHRLTKRTTLSLNLTWNEQQSDRGTLGQTTDFSNFISTFGINYAFDPIHVW